MKPTIWSRSFIPVLLTFFIDNFGLAIVYPIFTPLFLKPGLELYGANFPLLYRTFLLGLLIASFPLAQFFGAPLIGELSDRIGRKKVFIGTIIGGIVGYLLTGFGIHFKEIHTLWTGRVITGFFAGNLTLCLAAIADITHTKKERARNFGWIGTIGGLGFVLAIFAGGSFSNPDLEKFFRPEIPFFLTATLSFTNLWLMIYYFKERNAKFKHPQKMHLLKGIKNVATAFHEKKVRGIYIVYFLFILSWVTSMQFLSAYLIDNYNSSQNTIMLTFIFVGISWSVANFILNPILSEILRSPRVFLLGLLSMCTFLYLTVIPHEPLFLFLIHFFIATVSAALCWTNGLATISLLAPKNMQGRILGVNQSIVALASIIGPILGGIISGIDIHKLYLFTASSTLLSALLLSFKRYAIRKE